MSEGQVHPAIVIEVENSDAETKSRRRDRPRLLRMELPFSRVLENRRRLGTSDNDVDGAVIVIVSANSTGCGTGDSQTDRLCHVSESAVPVVPPHNMVAAIL